MSFSTGRLAKFSKMIERNRTNKVTRKDKHLNLNLLSIFKISGLSEKLQINFTAKSAKNTLRSQSASGMLFTFAIFAPSLRNLRLKEICKRDGNFNRVEDDQVLKFCQDCS